MCHDADINLLGSQMDMVNYLLDMKDWELFFPSTSVWI
jgi:hypothetical protein